MIKKLPDRIFFILVVLIIILIAILSNQYLKSTFLANHTANLFNEFVTDLENNNFDAEKYWQFRERYSPGTFLRDEQNVDFFATFKIVAVQEGLTPLFYYESDNLRSLDSVISYDANSALNTFKDEFKGEIVTNGENYVLIKVTQNEYVFAFVETISEMQKVNGMFDYLPEEKELLKDKLWYNTTYLKVM